MRTQNTPSALLVSALCLSLTSCLNTTKATIKSTLPSSDSAAPSTPSNPVTPPVVNPPVTPPVTPTPTPTPTPSPSPTPTPTPTPSPSPSPTPTPSPSPSPTPTPTPTPPAVVREFNVRPYGPKAPWNRPIAGLPLHAQSSLYAQYMYDDMDSSKRPEMNFRKYTYPVYNAAEATTEYTVIDRNRWGNLHNQKIPFNPSWKQNDGTDAQIIILDPASGKEWNLWDVVLDHNAKTVSIGNGNLCPGDYLTNNYDTNATKCQGSRGVGINYLAMLVRPFEIEQGKIEHALSMPIKGTSGSFFVAPATKLEHPGKVGNIPEGMRFALKITDAEIDAQIARLQASPYSKNAAQMRAVRIILVALRDYGWFITDTAAGHAFQFEAPESALDKWKSLGIVVNLDQDMFPRYMLDGLLTPSNIITIAPSDQYPALP